MTSTMGRQVRLRLDLDKCRACRRCPAGLTCRVRALRRLDPDEPPFVDVALCTDCRLCIPACPFDALFVPSSANRRPIPAIGEEDFEQLVLRANRPVVVAFVGPDCGPCTVLDSVLRWAAVEYRDRLAVVLVDVAEQPALRIRCGVQAIPTLLIYLNGRVRDHFIGQIPQVYLRRKLEPLLGESESADTSTQRVPRRK